MSDQFWTLYNFTQTGGHPPFKRLIQNRLRERMEKLVHLHPKWNDNDYVHYFGEILNDDSRPETEKRLAHLHLLAYFDRDRCYLIWRNWCHLPFYATDAENLYALTNEHLCNREKLQQYLSKYQTNGYGGASLKTYMVGILRNVIRDYRNSESRWHLLCNVEINSQRKFQKAAERLRAALNKAGTKEPEISQYLFAWRYFIPIYKNNRVYHPDRREGGKWPEPELADFAQTAKDYNSQRFQLGAPVQVAVGTDVAPATIQKWMNICIHALQQSSQILEVPYDADINQQPDETSFDAEDIDQNETQTESLPAIDLALKGELEIIEQNLDKARSQIPKSYRLAVMPLCYPHRLALLTQEQLSSKIGVHQGTISRYISKNVEVPLLEKFQALTSERINLRTDVKTFLNEKFTYLNSANPIEAQLIAAIAALDAQSQQILKLSYGQKLGLIELTRTLSQAQPTSQEEVQKKLGLAQNQLEKNLSNLLNQWQSNYVKLWLKNYYQNLIQSGLLKSFEQLGSQQKEILCLRYSQKQDIKTNSQAWQTLAMAKQQLQRSFLWWIENHFGLSLEKETQQVGEIVEDWLSQDLLYLEIQRN
ncbi:helix-turn-helix transcriptional regulator [Nostoc sp. FACHB-152]|uniref:helix-turn-helix domain-containing protein n=1 Tax=unclassified Nostoc TaxID=2593658 RepID=UPI001686AD99|nr:MULTISPECIES: helix-turn-helix transcriptional regulator [unclassified Nostoc]MBD2449668.1 helix-turn-helix transcriptional regulator [Nostoc sp. FACHB-152]MBD2469668.1 helix-turn-helix transcriptional regulator [Nostoc sp. FACHB-145]